MAVMTGASETWQARITHDLAAQLREDAQVLGLDGRTEIVKAALETKADGGVPPMQGLTGHLVAAPTCHRPP